VALIVFHAGMPKTGSTNIQNWLAEHLSLLQGQGIQCMRIARPTPSEPITLIPATRTAVTSTFLANDAATRPAVVEQICVALEAHAANSDVLVISSESYEILFNAPGRLDVLPHLDALARTHPVRVAYYVRPQDTWLESAWLQWGFRHASPPDAWIRRQRERIDYLQTQNIVREAAPHLSFEMRPFRRDLLEGGQVVNDFASIFLGLKDLPPAFTQERQANRGLPMEAAMLLRDAPPGLFWSTIHDNKTFYPLKELILQWKIPPSEVVLRVREVLRRYAYTTFERDNQTLIAELGWETEHFVSPIDDAGDGDAGLAELNVLLRSGASEAERRILYCALQQLLANAAVSPPSSTDTPPSDHPKRLRNDEENLGRVTKPPLHARAEAAVGALSRRKQPMIDYMRRRIAGTSLSTDSTAASPGSSRNRSAGRDNGPYVVDVAAEVGLELRTRTFGAVVFDYNNDGWSDIFLGRHDGPAFLYRNDHGRFTRVDAGQFSGTDRHCAAAGDLTGSGRCDIFCVVGGDSGHGPKRTSNELWIQQPDGTFVNEGGQPGLADPYGRGREVVLFDVNGNGRLDILVGNVSPRSDGKPSPNRLFVNEGNGRFRPAPEFGLDLEYSVGGAGRPGSPHGGGNWPMGRLRTIDADGNGWTDAVMCAQRMGDAVQRIHLFHNDEGRRFDDVTADVGLGGIEARDVSVADLTGDGQPDLVIVNREGLTICINDHGRFRVGYQQPIEHAFRVAVADADGDGYPDIYVMRTSGVPGPDIPDLLLVSNGTFCDYRAIILPTVEGTVRDDDVYPIDYDRDGRWEFLVLHGHSPHAAPIQLIALR
jgi:hypothetical protein